MSTRLLSARLAALARPSPHHAVRQFHHRTASAAGALLRTESGVRAARRRIWPMGYNFLHNAVAVRNASFVRLLPKLALKFARIPAMFGGAIIAGLAYLQYQATQAGNYAMDLFRQAGDAVGGAAGGLFDRAKDIAEQTRRGWENTKESIDLPEMPEWMKRILTNTRRDWFK